MRTITCIIIILITVSPLPINASEEYTSYSILFISIPNGTREIAMGETGVSHAQGGAAAWWNPAFLATEQNEIGFQVFRWIADSRGSFAGARFRTGWGGVGVYYFNQGMDGFEARTSPGPPQGYFSSHQVVFAGGTGVNISKDIAIGAVYKTALEDIYGYRSDDYHALDFGIKWHKEDWTAGVSLSNMELYNDMDEPFPTTLRFGMARHLDIEQFGIILAVEGSNMLDGDSYIHIGLETDWSDVLFLRGGFMSGHDSRGISFGAGVKHRRYRADVSITPFDNSLGTVWRLGIGITI